MYILWSISLLWEAIITNTSVYVAAKALAIYPNTYDLQEFKVWNLVRRSENITQIHITNFRFDV